ncbi:MAG: alpha-amylase family glycosyl hydrolase, partial [Poseidonia sp.]
MRATPLFIVFILIAVVATPFLSNEAQAAEGRSSTAMTLTYTGSASSVQLIGEWDWSTPLEMNLTNGVWTVDLDVPEGLYCYKFVVDGTYLFDPTNPERVYCDDIENSLLRVDDHLRPHYSANIVGDELHVVYHAGSSGASHDGTPAALSGATWDAVSSTWALDLTQLEDGKHSLLIDGFDVEGNPAYDLLVPFWRGPHASFVWEDALIYMIMTDRFVNANLSNDGVATGAAQGADWQGGDFAGVTEKIQSGYFADLGVNALWLTPFNTAANGTGKAADGVHDVAAFHGYWPTEARGVEPRLGTPDELHAMVDAAHDAGMRVMMDFVVNHVHEDHEYFEAHPEWFNTGCICGQANCDWTEHRLDCQFTAYMPDVNWKNRNASEQFIADALWWMETFDLDGARIDAVKHVENLAVSNLVAQINERFETVGTDVYLKGETAMGWSGHSLEANQAQYDAINAYMGPDGLDGQADFVLYHAVVDNVFVSGNENYQHLDYWTNRSQDQYTAGSLMVPYVGSHDVSRLTSRADTGTGDAYNQWAEDGLPGQPGDVSAYHAALQAYGWLLTTPGAPLLYYGDEYGEYGGADPDNRHMYRNESGWNDNEAALFENISALGQLRLESVALRQGEYSTRLAMPNLLAYNMTHNEQTMTVVLNRGGPTQMDGFDANDTVRFGPGSMANGTLTIPAHSVSVIELNA